MQRDKRYLDRCKSQMQPMNKQSVLKVKKTFFFPIAPFISIVSPLQSQEREKGKPTFSVSLFFVRVLPLFFRRRRETFKWVGASTFSPFFFCSRVLARQKKTQSKQRKLFISPPRSAIMQRVIARGRKRGKRK